MLKKDVSEDTDIKTGTNILTHAFRARVCIKCAGKEYEQFRMHVTNGYVARIREQPHDIAKSNMQLKNYRPHVAKKKPKDGNSAQHLIDVNPAGKKVSFFQMCAMQIRVK